MSFTLQSYFHTNTNYTNMRFILAKYQLSY